VDGAAAEPWYGIGTTVIGVAEALPPTMSISRPLSCADAAKGSNRAVRTASQRGSFFMGRSAVLGKAQEIAMRG